VRDDNGSPSSPDPGGAAQGWKAVGIFALAVAAAYQLVCALQPREFLMSNVFLMDDAYYYLQVARNVAEHGRVSFDGIHATSGIQPRWTVLLSGLALVVQGKIAFLRAVMILSIALNVLAGLQLFALGRRIHSEALGGAAVVLWSGFLLALAPTMIAMEYPLYVCTLLAILSLAWSIWHAPDSAGPGRTFSLGVLLAVLYWVRLDSAFFSVVVAAILALRLLRAGPGTGWTDARWIGRAAGLVVPGLVGAVLYVSLCLAVADAPMPISGLVKKYYSSIHFDGHDWWLALAGHVLWWVQVQCRPALDAICSAHTEALSWTHPFNLMLLAGMLGATGLGARRVWRGRASDPVTSRAAAFLGVAWLIGALHAVLVVWSIGHFARVTQHYYGWSLVVWIAWTALLIVGRRGRTARAPAVLAVLFLALVATVAWRHFTYASRGASLHLRRAPTIDWIAANLPPDARLGAWNAGQFGYFCDQPVVNLDGLANDRPYLELLRSGRPVREYLREEGIEYVVDTHALDLTMPYGTVLDDPTMFRGMMPLEGFEEVWRESDSPRAIVILKVGG